MAKRFLVGMWGHPEVAPAEFDTEYEASLFISTQLGCKQGLFFIDDLEHPDA